MPKRKPKKKSNGNNNGLSPSPQSSNSSPELQIIQSDNQRLMEQHKMFEMESKTGGNIGLQTAANMTAQNVLHGVPHQPNSGSQKLVSTEYKYKFNEYLKHRNDSGNTFTESYFDNKRVKSKIKESEREIRAILEEQFDINHPYIARLSPLFADRYQFYSHNLEIRPKNISGISRYGYSGHSQKGESSKGLTESGLPHDVSMHELMIQGCSSNTTLWERLLENKPKGVQLNDITPLRRKLAALIEGPNAQYLKSVGTLLIQNVSKLNDLKQEMLGPMRRGAVGLINQGNNPKSISPSIEKSTRESSLSHTDSSRSASESKAFAYGGKHSKAYQQPTYTHTFSQQRRGENARAMFSRESSTDDEMEGSNENNIVRTLLRSIDRYIIEIYNGNNLQILENTNNLRLRLRELLRQNEESVFRICIRRIQQFNNLIRSQLLSIASNLLIEYSEDDQLYETPIWSCDHTSSTGEYSQSNHLNSLVGSGGGYAFRDYDSDTDYTNARYEIHLRSFHSSPAFYLKFGRHLVKVYNELKTLANEFKYFYALLFSMSTFKFMQLNSEDLHKGLFYEMVWADGIIQVVSMKLKSHLASYQDNKLLRTMYTTIHEIQESYDEFDDNWTKRWKMYVKAFHIPERARTSPEDYMNRGSRKMRYPIEVKSERSFEWILSPQESFFSEGETEDVVERENYRYSYEYKRVTPECLGCIGDVGKGIGIALPKIGMQSENFRAIIHGNTVPKTAAIPQAIGDTPITEPAKKRKKRKRKKKQGGAVGDNPVLQSSDMGGIQNGENRENRENRENTENTGSRENTGDINNTGNIENTENTGDINNTESNNTNTSRAEINIRIPAPDAKCATPSPNKRERLEETNSCLSEGAKGHSDSHNLPLDSTFTVTMQNPHTILISRNILQEVEQDEDEEDEVVREFKTDMENLMNASQNRKKLKPNLSAEMLAHMKALYMAKVNEKKTDTQAISRK